MARLCLLEMHKAKKENPNAYWDQLKEAIEILPGRVSSKFVISWSKADKKKCLHISLFASCLQIKKAFTKLIHKCLIFKWAHLGLNQGPPDYESGALTS